MKRQFSIAALISIAGALAACETNSSQYSDSQSANASRRSGSMRAETDQRPADFPHNMSTESGTLRDDRSRASTDGWYDSQGNWVATRSTHDSARYDAQGNRIANQEGATDAAMYNGGRRSDPTAPSAYNEPNRQSRYDAQGNRIDDSNRQPPYDAQGNRIDDSNRQPRYDAQGNRIDDSNRQPRYDAQGNRIEEEGATDAAMYNGGRRNDPTASSAYNDSNRQSRHDAQGNRLATEEGATDAAMYNGGRRGDFRAARYYDERGNQVSDQYVRYDESGSHVEYRDARRGDDAGRARSDRTQASDSREFRSTDSPMYNGGGRPGDDASQTRNAAVDRTATSTDARSRDAQGNSPDQRPVSQTDRSADAATFASTDAKVLSVLHCKNEEEIQIGRLAQEKGTTEEVRKYGEQLVRDHTESDAKVRSVASAAKITLAESAVVKQALAKEKDPKHEKEGAKEPQDCLTELRALSGEEFDRQFALKMQEGHREMIKMLEEARPRLADANVRKLVDNTLTSLRKHEQMAAALDDGK